MTKRKRLGAAIFRALSGRGPYREPTVARLPYIAPAKRKPRRTK